jgi:hypothetical protein
MCGAVVRRCWLAVRNAGNAVRNAGNAGSNTRCNTGRNAGDNARNASDNARARRWGLQAAPVVTPGGAARSLAPPASWLCCLGAGLVSEEAARCAGGLHPRARPVSDVGAHHGSSSHASTVPASLACFTAPPVRRIRPCWPAELCMRSYLPCSCQIGTSRYNYGECATAPSLGTLGGMIHATQTARQRTRRAPTPPRTDARVRTCPGLANAAQRCPTRTVSLTVRATTRDNAVRAVSHNGGPRSWGRAVVDGSRSATLLHAPGVRAGGPSRHGGARLGDRCAPSNLQQSGELQP